MEMWSAQLNKDAVIGLFLVKYSQIQAVEISRTGYPSWDQPNWGRAVKAKQAEAQLWSSVRSAALKGSYLWIYSSDLNVSTKEIAQNLMAIPARV